MNLGAVSVLFIASLATEFHHGIDQYKGEAVYAICVAVISVVLVMLFSVWKYTKSNVTVSIWEALIWVLVAVAWVIAAVIVTFRGPFDTMGNGYFSSWIGASIAFSTSTSAWKARSRDVPV
jgi:beta-lactamase regulating signal transducer with metallopeptidase domain